MDKLQKTTAKHSKKLNSPFSQRKMSSSDKKNEFLALVVTIFLSSMIGTCLDAFF
ncbi:CBO0543 family protein, partial [Bacillus sp. HC-Mk]